MLKFRKPVSRAAVVAVACSALLAANPTDSFAQSFEGTFLQIHPEGPNNQINTTTEARGILNGTVLDVIINEVVTQTDDILTVDFGGGGGNFANDQNPYSNGVEGADMNDFIQYVSGTITIPEGEWTVGFGSDDGGFLNLPGISFDETFNEGGSGRIDGDGEILFDGTRGHNWTAATFTVSEDTTTGFEALMFERGGGDSLEVAYVNAIYDPEIDGGLNEFMASGFELDNGDFGDWSLTDDPFVPAGASSDLNGDGNVDFADFTIMSDNWGNPYGFDEFHALTQSFGGAGEAASVPEPTSLSLSLVSVLLLFGARRRRR